MVPRTFAVVPGGFAWFDHTGAGHALPLDALVLLDRHREPRTPGDAPEPALTALLAAGLLAPAPDDAADADHVLGTQAQVAVEQARLRRLVDADATLARRRSDQQATALVPVVPVAHPVNAPNLALGLIVAYARVHDGGRLQAWYDLEPSWLARPASVRRLLARRGPGVFLFSNYIWSHEQNLALSALVKQLSPDSVTIHGGPNTPSYEADTERFLLDHPHVDIAVRGEGELTTAEILEHLVGRLDGRAADGFAGTGLEDVAGIAFRRDGGVVRTPDRPRVEDPDRFPSPYLTGVFEAFGDGAAPFLVIESNRGCPYGCTFCDWGSATMSRIRKFPLERVFAELEWAARHRVPELWCSDANFGILARDVEIAEHIARLHRQHGFPGPSGCPTPRTYEQAPAPDHRDPRRCRHHHLGHHVGAVVRPDDARSGPPVQHQDRPLRRARRRVPPVGPAPVDRHHDGPAWLDLRLVLRRPAVVHRPRAVCQRQRHGPAGQQPHERADVPGRATSRPSTAAPTPSGATWWCRRRRSPATTTSAWTGGARSSSPPRTTVLRQVGRWVRQETGRREMDLLRLVVDVTDRDPDRYPALAWAVAHLVAHGVPPLSWAHLLADVEAFLVDELGVEPASDLRTVLTVQAAMLPDPGRRFPESVALDHDFVAWHRAVAEAKRRTADWAALVPACARSDPGCSPSTAAARAGPSAPSSTRPSPIGSCRRRWPARRTCGSHERDDDAPPPTAPAPPGPGRRTAVVRLVVIVLVVVVASELFVRWISPQLPPARTAAAGEVQVKDDQMRRLGAVGVAFVGDSTLDSGADPTAFLDTWPAPASAYNASLMGSRLPTLGRWYGEVVRDRIQPALVVQGVSVTLVSDLGIGPDQLGVYDAALTANIDIATSDGWQQLSRDAAEHVYLVRHRNALRSPTVVLQATANRITGEEPAPQSVRPPGFWEQTVAPTGQVTEFFDEVAAPTGPDKLMDAVRSVLDGQESFGPLDALLLRYRDAGQAVVAVVPPVAFDVLSASGIDVGAWRARSARLVDHLRDGGVAVVDFTDAGYPRELFFDPFHLNRRGSTRFSHELATRVRALCTERAELTCPSR
ncbi:MAG: hypothetical protein R2726_06470 [Acidimicrobiales bacterium]